MPKSLHIVSFNVPYPANYGGVIDVYYRLQALAAQGLEIHLHAFTYGRDKAPQLEKYCQSVTYYRRRMSPLKLLGRRPFIVNSRDVKQLIENLQKDDIPIFLEGLHCCSVLEHISGRTIFVRAHNVEHEYYGRLADSERKPLKRIYLRSDARKLRRYEPILLKASGVFAVTEADAAHFAKLGCKNVWLMPSSHNNNQVVSQTGIGDYVLYHADLSVPENIQAVNYLADNIFSKTRYQYVVAGRNPHTRLKSKLSTIPNVKLVSDPDDETMSRLITDAQVIIMVTNQPTGLKLKLLNSLYAGRHCLVNSLMVAGTKLGEMCTVADDPGSQLKALDRLMNQPMTEQDIAIRKSLLGDCYSNESNARILIDAL